MYHVRVFFFSSSSLFFLCDFPPPPSPQLLAKYVIQKNVHPNTTSISPSSVCNCFSEFLLMFTFELTHPYIELQVALLTLPPFPCLGSWETHAGHQVPEVRHIQADLQEPACHFCSCGRERRGGFSSSLGLLKITFFFLLQYNFPHGSVLPSWASEGNNCTTIRLASTSL